MGERIKLSLWMWTNKKFIRFLFPFPFPLAGPSRPNSLFYDESPERAVGGALDVVGPGSGGNIFRDSITSASLLLEGCDPDSVAWAPCNSNGCRVNLKDSGVNLTIPEGALSKTEEVFCAILTEDKDRPVLNGESKFIELGTGQDNTKPSVLCEKGKQWKGEESWV